MIPETMNSEEANQKYYEQYCKILDANNILLSELRQFVSEKN